MKRLIAVLAAILLTALTTGVVMATTLGFGSGSVPWTQAAPGRVDLSTNAVGTLQAGGVFEGKGATITIAGPASCTATSGHGPNKYVGCYIADAPVGDYVITVAPKGDYGILFQGSITGEIVIPYP